MLVHMDRGNSYFFLFAWCLHELCNNNGSTNNMVFRWFIAIIIVVGRVCVRCALCASNSINGTQDLFDINHVTMSAINYIIWMESVWSGGSFFVVPLLYTRILIKYYRCTTFCALAAPIHVCVTAYTDICHIT